MAEEAEDAQGNIADERNQILQLQSEQFRKQEQLESLKRKCRALDDELSIRRTELEDARNKFQHESMNAESHSTKKYISGDKGSKTTAAENEFITREVKRLLEERIPVMASEPDEGDDGGDFRQMEETTKQDDSANLVHDTVLVSYVFIYEGKKDEYRVSFRIDGHTKVEQLLKDACAYWGCSHNDYVLCRQKLQPLEDPGRLLQDSEVLNPAEQAWLQLIKKDLHKPLQEIQEKEKQRNETREQQVSTTDTEKEDHAYLRSLFQQLGWEKSKQETENFVTAFKPWPGVSNLLKDRSRKPEDQKKWKHARCSDCSMYALLILLSILCIGFRNETDDFMLRDGVKGALSTGIARETSQQRDYSFLHDDFDSRNDVTWTDVTAGVSWSEGAVRFSGANESMRATRSLHSDMGNIKVSVLLAASNCSDFFVMFAKSPGETWSQAPSPGALKLMVNCENLTAWTQGVSLTSPLLCDSPEQYEFSIFLNTAGSVQFTDGVGCTAVTLVDSLAGSEGPLYLYIGTDADDGSGGFDQVSVTTTGLEDVMSVDSIHRYDDIWTWLGGSFHYQVFNNESALRQNYAPVGFLRIRQQRAKAYDCERGEVPFNLQRQCYYIYSSDDMQAKNELDPVPEWNDGAGHTGSVRSPREWVADQIAMDGLNGIMMNSKYDGSGYSISYELLALNLSYTGQAFAEELPKLRDHWVDIQTRMITVELTLANYNLGGYVAATYLLEISPAGAVHATHFILPFHIARKHGDDVAQGLDIVRWVIVILFIMLVRLWFETKRRVDLGESGLTYVFSFGGVIDMFTVALFFAIQFMRFKSPPPEPTRLRAFYSYLSAAETAGALMICEAVLLIAFVVRFATFLRMLPPVFRFGKTFAKSLRMFAYFSTMFVPVFLGAVFFASAIWSPYVAQFSKWTETLYTLLVAINESLDVTQLNDKNRWWTIAFLTYFFLSMYAFFVNVFLAITVHAFFEVELIDGADPEAIAWSWDQWLDWMLWPPVYTRITGRKPGSSMGRGSDGDSSDDDEGSDDDEEPEDKRQ